MKININCLGNTFWIIRHVFILNKKNMEISQVFFLYGKAIQMEISTNHTLYNH